MPSDRIHRAISVDGTEIAGRVHGQGPPLVLFHGTPHDGDLAWEALVPHLADRFTCYLPNARGKGLSGDSDDHTPPRHEEDATVFVDSIGGSVHVAGWSYGALPALGAAANSDAVTSLAIYEPTIIPLMRQDDLAEALDNLQVVGAAAADGRLADASRAFHRYVCTDDEMAAALETDYFDRCAGILPAAVQVFQQDSPYEGPRATDPEVLRTITVPILLLRGQQTLLATFVADSAQHIAEHVADPRVRELPGVGHFAPVLAPEPVAKALISFFESVRRPEPA